MSGRGWLALTPLLYRLGGFCVRRRWFVVACWLAIFAFLAVAARNVGPDLNVAVAVCATVTLLPAILAIVGDRIDALALPHRRRLEDDHPHGWERWARFVGRRPLPCALVAVVVLVALALPTLDLYLGQQDNGALPTDTQARQAYDGLTGSFGVGANGPLLVSVDMSQQPAKPDQAKLDDLDTQEAAQSSSP